MMFAKQLRQKALLSQEHLSELSGLSLRTIQRVESGHRVSYGSLRALAVVYEISVNELERELYAMENISEDFVEIPLWARLLLGRGWFGASRQTLHRAEIGMILIAIIMCTASVIVPGKQFPLWNLTTNELLLIGGTSQFFGAYLNSIVIRIGDKYRAWPAIESKLSGSFFGLKLSKNQAN